jgi:Domain of unknown function (DUF3425)
MQEYHRRHDADGFGYVLDPTNVFVKAPITVYGSPNPPPGEKLPAPFVNFPPIWKILPRVFSTCHFDHLLLNYLRDSQSRIARGESTCADEAGPEDPDFNILVDSHTRHKPHQLSRLFTDILKTFPDLKYLPEQIAVVYILYLNARWLIDPSKENYERLPDWIKPTCEQLLQPHSFWLDSIPW